MFKSTVRTTTHITIPTSQSHVWSVLDDTAAYYLWNPFIRQIDGRYHEGNSIHLFINPPNDSAITADAKVTMAEPGKHIAFRVIMNSLFPLYLTIDILLEPIKEGQTTVTINASYSGYFAKRKTKNLESLKQGAVTMLEALRVRLQSI